MYPMYPSASRAALLLAVKRIWHSRDTASHHSIGSNRAISRFVAMVILVPEALIPEDFSIFKKKRNYLATKGNYLASSKDQDSFSKS